ncbi:MAG: hypothetical protein GWN16_00480 [Calditrichae bacterium]|nr:hypothetical protein [Calditrichia bacterium]NIW78009.1 hypothetical protein [Calditrichia bacterium]
MNKNILAVIQALSHVIPACLLRQAVLSGNLFSLDKNWIHAFPKESTVCGGNAS